MTFFIVTLLTCHMLTNEDFCTWYTMPKESCWRTIPPSVTSPHLIEAKWTNNGQGRMLHNWLHIWLIFCRVTVDRTSNHVICGNSTISKLYPSNCLVQIGYWTRPNQTGPYQILMSMDSRVSYTHGLFNKYSQVFSRELIEIIQLSIIIIIIEYLRWLKSLIFIFRSWQVTNIDSNLYICHRYLHKYP